MSRTADSFGDGEAATTLTNVVRAGASLPLEFFAPGTYTATRSATLGIGLPQVTFGPHQTFLERQAIFGGNAASTALGYSATSSPIVTQEFTNALLSQATVATLGTYIDQGFSRETLFSLFVDSIEVSEPIDGHEYREVLVNAPALDAPAVCSEAADYNPAVVAGHVGRWFEAIERIRADRTLPFAEKQARIREADRIKAATPAACPYHRLRFYIGLALDAGLSVRRDETPDPPDAKGADEDKPTTLESGGGGAKPTPAPPQVLGRFCFSRALGKSSFFGATRPDQFTEVQRCEGVLRPPSGLKVPIADPRGGVIEQQFVIRLRSPMQMFRYLGDLTHDPARAALAGIAIDGRRGRDCAVLTLVRSRPYCVPESARRTLEAITVLNLLVRQSTKRDDVPKSVTLTL